jgi:hypothetical protein
MKENQRVLMQMGQRAQNPKEGMTLAEMVSFAEEALAAGIPPEASIRVRTGWGQQVQQLIVNVPPGVRPETGE